MVFRVNFLLTVFSTVSCDKTSFFIFSYVLRESAMMLKRNQSGDFHEFTHFQEPESGKIIAFGFLSAWTCAVSELIHYSSVASEYEHTRGPNTSYPMVTGGYIPRDLAADHSPPTSAKVKKTWIYTSTPPLPLYIFRAQCLVKHRDTFTLPYSIEFSFLHNRQGHSYTRK
jgi:hypothetical protein